MISNQESYAGKLHEAWGTHEKDREAKITIIEVKINIILPALFARGNTATNHEMNALAARKLYSFYLILMLVKKALTGPWWIDSFKERSDRFCEQGILVTVWTKGWKGPCGYDVCPAIARKVEGLRLIGVLRWDHNEVKEVEEKEVTEELLTCRMNRICWNIELQAQCLGV